ncbi:hypothetical protein LWI28_024351 [Acer negundo]|uniref:Uncharacterized protein n=1 Tax=Acer negundo TaxID=4023 RepID=A0AAD5J0Y5_ACENE|nr:hypothetical protein LWI28_024351 [Acer negundo]
MDKRYGDMKGGMRERRRRRIRWRRNSEDVYKAIESQVRKKSDPMMDKSEDFNEEPISEDELVAISFDDESFIANHVFEKGKRTRCG